MVSILFSHYVLEIDYDVGKLCFELYFLLIKLTLLKFK